MDLNEKLLGTLVDGKFRVLSVLGEGGMGAVYRAVDVNGNFSAAQVVSG